jgi:hypothetical protein
MRVSLELRRQSSGRSFAEFERFKPLLVGKKLIIFDPVSGGIDTVNHGGHNFYF